MTTQKTIHEVAEMAAAAMPDFNASNRASVAILIDLGQTPEFAEAVEAMDENRASQLAYRWAKIVSHTVELWMIENQHRPKA